MNNTWYQVVDETKNISQGDILFNCPIFSPIYPDGDLTATDFDNIDEDKLSTEVSRSNVIILNQSCDLEVREGQSEPKLKRVLVGLLQDVHKDKVGKGKIIPIAKNDKPQLFLLEPSFNSIRMGYQIVHFDIVETLPWKLLDDFSKVHGSRLRLKSPYLEQLSQSFGNYFGRVAIPENREETIQTFYDFKVKYEGQRKHHEKAWDQLTIDEVFDFIECNRE